MGRPRAFDELTVLDAAAGQFRVFGFEGSSTERLCEVAGVRRSSLYNAFVSKDELFVSALERYLSVVDEAQEAILCDESRSGRERLEALAEAILEEERVAAEQGHAAGCMVVNTYMSPGLRERDSRIARALDASLERRLSLLAQAIRVGQVDGSLRGDVDADDGALHVVTVVSGLRVSAQAVGPGRLRQVFTLGLQPLFA
ncbi:TetR/AcrR family transcriptional regulator [Nocardia yamanashiensis]|uniref:TetR/AcrR family transcriptional regulator n=1 Tax=Nocardia yamanashiensis TaxID=209247 RepID=UPI001E28DFB1|nr:TetR/AcrR family transcriptional regulator [Nocardia yamanashiensis]UGT44841.1 TetR/AcrR family transcriptional regulator [Nocardia yamanashiensis]